MTDPETLPLAADFTAATQADWQKLVDAVLKGAPLERLTSTTYDGLAIKPLYGRDPAARTIPGRTPAAAWTISQRMDHPDPTVANAQALDDLQNGATGLTLVFADAVGANGFGLDPAGDKLARALDGVRFDAGITLDVDLPPFARDVPQRIADVVNASVTAAKADVRFGYDPLTAAAMSGRMPLPWRETAPLMARLIRALADMGFKGPFAVGDGRLVHDTGGSEVQELAFALAAAVLYLRALADSGMTLEAARAAIYFRLTADADQFLTMAKFRAVRMLWARVEEACGLAPKPAVVAAETAWRMMSRRDTYANMLRTTIAVAAAGLGGADSITVLPHTAALGLPNPLARRIARNTQLVLLEESNLARVADPAAGSGALGAITQELCAAAWSLFQQIERSGGAWAALESGFIQRQVAAVRTERQKAAARRKDVLTGANAFPNLHESAITVLAVAPRPPAQKVSAGMAVEALPRVRLAEPFEALRDASDRLLTTNGARPKIFLAPLGTQAEFNARATFAKNFFEAGGIEGVSEDGNSPSPVALASSFKKSGAAIACLCSSDKVYEKEAAAAAQALKAAGAKYIYLAGRPGEHETEWRAGGVGTFIYEGCDALATLNAAYDILGIKIGG